MEIAFLTLGCSSLLALWILPVVLGVKAARTKGVSPHWMWFGVHPFFGWIAFLVIRFGITPRKVCPQCTERLKAHARVCAYCGHPFQDVPETTSPSAPVPSTGKGSRLGLVVGGILLAVVLFVAGIVGLVESMFRRSEAYRLALEAARRNPAAIQRLGDPIEPGWWTGSGSIQESGPTGRASLSIPVHGPKGAGTLYLEAKKRAGQWTVTLLDLEDSAGQRTHLLPAPPSAPPPAPAPES